MELQDIVHRLRMNQSIKAINRETGKHRPVAASRTSVIRFPHRFPSVFHRAA